MPNDFTNEQYGWGWLESTVRTLRADLIYAQGCHDPRMAGERLAIATNICDAAIKKCDEANAVRAHENEQKRKAAILRTNSARYLPEVRPMPELEKPLFLQQ